MSKPIVVKKDGAQVKIYEVSAGKGYSTYQLSYYQGGQRKRESISEKAAAIKRANDIVDNQSKGMASLNDLSITDREIYFECQRIIKPTGLTLMAACTEFVRTWRRDFTPVTVRVTVTKYLNSLVEEKRSDSHRRTSKQTLEKFAAKFGGRNIDEMEPKEIRDWIAAHAKSGRTRNNWLNRIRTAFNYGKKELQGIKLGDVPAPTSIKLWEEEQSVIQPWKSMDLTTALANVIADRRREGLLPFVLVQAWGGLRVAEATRLQWKDVHVAFDKHDRPYVSHIEVGAAKAKTKSRRTVRCEGMFRKIMTFLVSTKKPFSNFKEERLSDYKEPQRELVKVLGNWRTNILRHSCATHLLNLWEDENRVAAYMGTSTEMLHSNYKELVSPRDARDWLEVDPFHYAEISMDIQDQEARDFIKKWNRFCAGNKYLDEPLT